MIARSPKDSEAQPVGRTMTKPNHRFQYNTQVTAPRPTARARCRHARATRTGLRGRYLGTLLARGGCATVVRLGGGRHPQHNRRWSMQCCTTSSHDSYNSSASGFGCNKVCAGRSIQAWRNDAHGASTSAVSIRLADSLRHAHKPHAPPVECIHMQDSRLMVKVAVDYWIAR